VNRETERSTVHDAVKLVQSTVGVAPTSGNVVTVLRNGDEIFPAMLEAIEAAERWIEVTTYVYWTGDIAERFAHTLADRAEDGVQVRVLVDWVGGRSMNRHLIEVMREAGVSFEWFRPPSRIAQAALRLDEGLVGQHRTHRKVLVCDGTVGFTGGVGIADEWTGDARTPEEWRDTHLRIEGPAVASLRSAFATNWHEASGEPLPVADRVPDVAPGDTLVQVVRGQPGRFVSDVALLFRALLDAAEDRIWVSSAYFVPDDSLVRRLTAAVDRGVDVQVMVPGKNIDKRVSQLVARAGMEPLLTAGVKICEYAPTMLHTKVFLADDVAVVGSANMNMRSLHQDDEVVAVIHDGHVTKTLADHFQQDLERSEPMEPGRFVERSLGHKAKEAVVNTLRRFM
jgi:cardiolipin synthase A/B